MGPPFPEVRQHAQVLASQLALSSQHEGEEINGTVRILMRHGGEGLSHTNHQEVAERQLRPLLQWELLQESVDEMGGLVPQIHPLRET